MVHSLRKDCQGNGSEIVIVTLIEAKKAAVRTEIVTIKFLADSPPVPLHSDTTRRRKIRRPRILVPGIVVGGTVVKWADFDGNGDMNKTSVIRYNLDFVITSRIN